MEDLFQQNEGATQEKQDPEAQETGMQYRKLINEVSDLHQAYRATSCRLEQENGRSIMEIEGINEMDRLSDNTRLLRN